ncbi:MAG: cell wall-binding repeat-containing protein, partial [Eggerthellaceae bacterium]|nr:cell wall-binding repeat-containing protein [Eggerthellaceae bacterium]
MYKIAKAGKGDFASEAVILATNKGYKDALAASSLAGILAAPVVLTTPDTLAAKAKQAIKESGAKTIYIVGGPKAVSNKVEKQIKSMGKDVERIYGNNAAETSVQIAMVVNYVLEQLKVEPKGDCIIATQASFKDALSIAPYSYTYGVPIYLTDGKGKSVSDLALREMRAGKHKRAIIVGGTKAVSSNVEKQLKDNGLKVVRLWGQNAYQTSNEIAKWEINNGMVVDYVGAATAKNFKDALSGAAYCGLYG